VPAPTTAALKTNMAAEASGAPAPDAEQLASRGRTPRPSCLELLRSENLPLPITNKPAGGHRVDCRWPEHRLTVELDGYRFHNSRHSWEQDRRREREARARGDYFRRYTYGDVFEHPRPMLAELGERLTQ
jgi:hypothetical protein